MESPDSLTVDVLDTDGLPEAQAGAWLVDVGFIVSEVTRAPDAATPEGRVVRTDPAKG